MPYKYLLSKYPWYNYISLIKHEKYWNSWNLCAFPAMFEWPESDFSSTIQAIGRNFHSSSTSLSHTQWLYCSFFFCHKLRYTQLWQLKITRNSVPNAPSPWVSRRFATSQFLRLLVKRMEVERVAAYLSKSQCFNRLEWLIHLMKKQQTVDFGVFLGMFTDIEFWIPIFQCDALHGFVVGICWSPSLRCCSSKVGKEKKYRLQGTS